MSQQPDPAVHAHQAHALPNERYEGPILPGQKWRSRGTGKHQRELYSVITFNGRTAKVTQEGNRHNGGKVYNIPEAPFRGNFNLVAQPRGVTASDLEQLAAEQQAQLQAGLVATRIVAVDPPPPDPIEVAIAQTRPPTPSRPLASLVVVEREVKENQMQTLPPTPTPVPPLTLEPVVVDNEVVDYTVPIPGHADELLSTWIKSGQSLIEGMTRELTAVDGKLAGLQLAVDTLTIQREQIKTERDRIEQAVLSAAAIARGDTPPSPPSPSLNASPVAGKPGQAGNQPQNKAYPGGPGKTAWVLDKAIGLGTFGTAELVPAYCARWGRTPAQASGDIGGILNHHSKARNDNFPALEMLGSGRYRVAP